MHKLYHNCKCSQYDINTYVVVFGILDIFIMFVIIFEIFRCKTVLCV